MSFGFGDPASFFGVAGQCFGVDALCRENGQRAGLGVEAGAVFADVRVGAGALGGCVQNPPASRILAAACPFQSAPPVMSASGSLICRPWGARLLFGQVEGPLVLGADGRVEQPPIAQAHLADMWSTSAISACNETPGLTRAVA